MSVDAHNSHKVVNNEVAFYVASKKSGNKYTKNTLKIWYKNLNFQNS